MNLISIAVRTVKKSIRDYAIYFLTLTFGICTFYVFNSLDAQRMAMGMTAEQLTSLKLIDRIMGNFSLFVSLILCFLIIYANRFLIKRRKREFGLYMTLGMRRGSISGILIAETLCIGLVSLICGFTLGILLSQAMAGVTSQLLGAQVRSFRFILSGAAILKTCLYFGLAFILTMIFNVLTVRKQKLIDLIYADRKNEWYKAPRQGLSVLLFFSALLLLTLAYLTVGDKIDLGPHSLSIAAALCFLGTFLFFFSLSGFFLQLIQHSKRIYFKNLNMFVLRQINSKINTSYVTMTLVCLMLALSVSTFSSGMGIAGSINENLRTAAPFDASLSISMPENGETWVPTEYPGINIRTALKKRGVRLQSFAKETYELRYYGPREAATITIKDINAIPSFVKLSDYNAVLKMQNIAPLRLANNEFALNAAAKAGLWQKALKSYAASNKARLTLGDTPLHTKPSLVRSHSLEIESGFGSEIAVVVPDQLIKKNAPALKDVLVINYPQENTRYEKACMDALAKIEFGLQSMTVLSSRTRLRTTSNTTSATIAYLVIYLGIVFLITSAAVLAISQLSETSDNTQRYRLLRKIGTDDSMLRQALFRQLLIFFGMPLLLALVHSLVALSTASRMAQLLARMDIRQGSLITAVVIVVVYGGYFLATYTGSKRILSKSMNA